MAQNNAIDAGIEYENDVRHEDAEVYGYVDDGEHAVVWAVWEDQAAESYGVRVYNCEAGLAEPVGRHDQDLERFDSVEDVARHFAESDPETSINEARDYWGR